VQKLMKLHGIRAKGKRRFKVTTDSNHDLPIAANLLDRQFNVAQPDKAWVGDITYIATDEGWLFLAVVVDLFSRQVVGWALRDDMTASLVVDALRTRRRQFKARTKDFRDTLEEYDITPSMSMRGNCWNNAVRIVES
jgi:putative transposase